MVRKPESRSAPMMSMPLPAFSKRSRCLSSRGRAFTAADGPKAQPVVIVNSAFAQKFFPGINPVGLIVSKNASDRRRRLRHATLFRPEPHRAHAKRRNHLHARRTGRRAPMLMVHVWFQPSWVVRTAGPVEGLTGQMQKALASVDPALPFSGFYRMSDLQAEALSEQRVEVALLGTMAGLALLLSAVGIFALVASLVTQKTREIGIRIALGSTIRQAMTHVSSSGVLAAGVGLALGLVLCFITLRTMRSVLYGVGVYDAPSLFAVIGTLAAVTLLAATIPALRIARIDPATTLREE